MHVSWAESNSPAEAQAVASGFDFACEAARRGHVAVCVELMGAGVRRPQDAGGTGLRSLAVHGMLLGHSLIGQHASDVSMVLNWVVGSDFGIAIDSGRAAVIGHDLGAAAGLLAAALDTRIAAIAMVEPPRRFRDAIKQRSVTPEMTMPGLLRWMDLDDILLLCAPRPIVAGPGRAGSAATAAELVAGARGFYDLFEAGSALTATDGLTPLWQCLASLLAEPGIVGREASL
jgi:pimeloyl-ACP methyl ester carboxylesterase